MQEHVWAAWHIKGAAGTFEQWISMPLLIRQMTIMQLQERIEAHNGHAAFTDFDEDF